MVFGIGKSKSHKHPKLVRQGRRAKIISNVGVCDDDDPGGSFDLKGETGVVVEGGNMVYQDPKTGEIKQAFQLDDGSGIVGVPARALKETWRQ